MGAPSLQSTPLKPCATHASRGVYPSGESSTPANPDAPAVLTVSLPARVSVATVQMAHTPFRCRNTHGMITSNHLAQHIVCGGATLEFGFWRSLHTPPHAFHPHVEIRACWYVRDVFMPRMDSWLTQSTLNTRRTITYRKVRATRSTANNNDVVYVWQVQQN